jgi:hypothetical protein
MLTSFGFFSFFFFFFFCMPAIHGGAAVLKTKFALGLRPSVCLTFGHKEACMHCGGLALQPELLESKTFPFSDPT